MAETAVARTAPRRTAMYLRISDDRNDTRLGVTRQREDCERRARERGWTVSEVFEDNDVSASTSKRRPAYSRMLAAIERGEIEAVVVWALDRLIRRPLELEHFIDLADRHHVELANVGGDVDLSTPAGRMVARMLGAVARHEVEQKGARHRRANLQKVQAGGFLAGRTFGYEPGGVALIEPEADAIRWAAECLLAGGSLRAIIREWQRRGLTTIYGGKWVPKTVRLIVANPRHAGLVVYQRQVMAGVRGCWPMILDEPTHYAIRAVLDDPERHKAGPPRRYMLSGVARCGVCGGPVNGARADSEVLRYRCPERHVAPRAEPLEHFIERLVIERLSQPDAVAVFARDERSTDVANLRDEQAGLRVRLDGLAEAFAAGEIDRAQLAAGSDKLRARLEAIERELAEAVGEPMLAQFVTASDVAAIWEGLDLDRKRAVLKVLMEITIMPAGRENACRGFDPRTVRVTWRNW